MGWSETWTCRKFLLASFIVSFIFLFIFSTQVARKNITFRELLHPHVQNDSSQTTTGSHATKITEAPITLFVRMSGSNPDHRFRYYCHLFRTLVLYWPPSFGKIAIVLDEEGKEDHKFAAKVRRENKRYFPDYKIAIAFEAPPKKKSTLTGKVHRKGYIRQLWSSFFIDQYTNDSIIAWMDTDTAFLTPVTNSTVFAGTKLRAMASDNTYDRFWVKHWIITNEIALGLPFVADFMIYFPVYIYRDTFTRCREYILKRFNSTDLEEVFPKFYETRGKAQWLEVSPVNIVLSYAWYFEKDRYDWSFEITSNLTEYNKKFPKGHAIGPEHTKTILSEPQTAFHTYKIEGKWIWSKILVSYCLSHRAAGDKVRMCTNHTASFKDNLPLFNYDLQFITDPNKSPCNTGNNKLTCLRILERHYNQVGVEINEGRKLEWSNMKIVEQFAKNSGIKCNTI